MSGVDSLPLLPRIVAVLSVTAAILFLTGCGSTAGVRLCTENGICLEFSVTPPKKNALESPPRGDLDAR